MKIKVKLQAKTREWMKRRQKGYFSVEKFVLFLCVFVCENCNIFARLSRDGKVVNTERIRGKIVIMN